MQDKFIVTQGRPPQSVAIDSLKLLLVLQMVVKRTQINAPAF